MSPQAHHARLREITTLLRQPVDTCSVSADETVIRFEIPATVSFHAAMERIEQYGVRAQPNFLYRPLDTPNDPGFAQQWSLHNTGEPVDAEDGADINAPEAWQMEHGDATVVIGVVDSGVDFTHPDLMDNMWRNQNDLVDGEDTDDNGYIDDHYGLNAITATVNPTTGKAPAGLPKDDTGHGTRVAGVIGARGNNGTLIAGVLWDTKIVACKFISAGQPGCTCNAIKCLDYLTDLKNHRGVNVVATTASWGTPAHDPLLMAAIARQRDAGILFVAAAGNHSTDNDCQPEYPASYTLSNVISVGASDKADGRTPLSNCGRHSVHVVAPGMNVPTLQPGSYRNVVGKIGGTSAAAPHVSGLIGLLASWDRRDGTVDWPWWALRNLILTGGQFVPAASRTVTGRRIRAASAPSPADAPATGSLTCNQQTLRRRLQPLARHTEPDGSRVVRVSKGTPVELSAISIACAQANGPVHVVVHRSSAADEWIQLSDEHANGDQTPGDGIFVGTWPPGPETTTAELAFHYGTAPAEQASDRVTVHVVDTLPALSPCPCAP